MTSLISRVTLNCTYICWYTIKKLCTYIGWCRIEKLLGSSSKVFKKYSVISGHFDLQTSQEIKKSYLKSSENRRYQYDYITNNNNKKAWLPVNME